MFRRLLAVLLVICVLPFGCGKKGGLAGQEAFAKAPADISQLWQQAIEASRTNDYTTAETLLYTLYGRGLSAQQQEAVGREISALNQRLSDAAKKGDPAAKQAIEALRRSPPNRPSR